jgi:hypothetical protein
MTNASTALQDNVLWSRQLTATEERSLVDVLHDCYEQTGTCTKGMLLHDLLRRIEAEEPEALTLVPPATLAAAAKWIDSLRQAMFTQGRTVILGTGGNSPAATWISDHGEVVLEWSAAGRRLSFYLHANYTSAVISAMVNGSPVSQHVDGVPSEVAAEMLMAFQGRV